MLFPAQSLLNTNFGQHSTLHLKIKMTTIFDDKTRESLIKRIETLAPADQAQWGKMNVSQMIEHCTRLEKIMSGKIKVKRVFLGYIFGKVALRSMIGNDKPMRTGIPTLPELVVRETAADIEPQKQKWIDLLEELAHNSSKYFMHPFCGRMTREQTGKLEYKHIDHHLRQFGR